MKVERQGRRFREGSTTVTGGLILKADTVLDGRALEVFATLLEQADLASAVQTLALEVPRLMREADASEELREGQVSSDD